MKIKLIYATFGLCALLLSGCYTVLYGPRMAVAPEESELAVVEEAEQYQPPVLGRYDEYEEEDWDDFYRYPGTRSGYGGGYGYGGYPYYGNGYNSGYDYYGYGPYPYYGYYGYGPSSYGYDPYYRDRGGSYVPVGYTLVTQRELDQLRASSQGGMVDQLDPAELEMRRLEQQRKVLTDAVKMVAYRAETQLANLVGPLLPFRTDEARSFLKKVFQLPADLLPDPDNGRLVVRLYGMANPRSNRVLAVLCDLLNGLETVFPGTSLRLVLETQASQK